MQGWRSPYTLSFSAINTWVGEELRTIGAEYSLDWLGRSHGHDFDFTLNAAAYGWNDTGRHGDRHPRLGIARPAEHAVRPLSPTTARRSRSAPCSMTISTSARATTSAPPRTIAACSKCAPCTTTIAPTSPSSPRTYRRAAWLTYFDSLGRALDAERRLDGHRPVAARAHLRGRRAYRSNAWSFDSEFLLASLQARRDALLGALRPLRDAADRTAPLSTFRSCSPTMVTPGRWPACATSTGTGAWRWKGSESDSTRAAARRAGRARLRARTDAAACGALRALAARSITRPGLRSAGRPPQRAARRSDRLGRQGVARYSSKLPRSARSSASCSRSDCAASAANCACSRRIVAGRHRAARARCWPDSASVYSAKPAARAAQLLQVSRRGCALRVAQLLQLLGERAPVRLAPDRPASSNSQMPPS